MSNSKIYLGSNNLGTGKIRLGANDVSAIYLGASLLYPPTQPTPTPTDPDMLHFTAQQANSTIGYTSTLATPPTIYKSTDGVNFTSWDGTAVTLSNIGDVLYVYGSNQTLAESTNVQPFRNYTKFVMTGGIAAEGDATYLLQNGGLSTITNNYVLYGLFENCTSLTQAPSLPSTTLGRECYGDMFYGCTGLTQAPQLPATTLAYNCYVSMFYGCTSLTQAPTLSATTLAQGCYSYMFKGCTSLTTEPVLASTTLAYDCYYGMFEGCTALTTAPNLPATTITTDCYASMFKGCTSLTTAPQLPATTLDYGCYQEMFRGCTSLTQAPALPATTLLDNCYQQMFQGCTSLTTAPYLPATTLVQECYSGMFKDCSSLNSITCLATSISALLCTYNWLENVAATGTFTKSPDMSSWTTGTSGIPSGWTVVDAQ